MEKTSRRDWAIRSILYICCALVAPMLSADTGAPAAAALAKQYCVGCHSAKAKTGGVVLEGIDWNSPAANGATLEKVLRKVKTGEMPPAGLPHPKPADATALLQRWVQEGKLPSYRAAQLQRRLWQAPVRSWSEATELPLALREQMDRAWPLTRLRAEAVQQSADGTRKYLWRLEDGEAIESVLIPSGKRLTLCISSQAGCALGCVFCATGRMGFRRNLSAWEIAAQVREIVLENPASKPTNIVFMGMGEPLLNWPAVDVALSILNDPAGFGIGARHITVSTVGILPGMAELAKRSERRAVVRAAREDMVGTDHAKGRNAEHRPFNAPIRICD